MAKALLGQRIYVNDSQALESARLRSRVRDLETMIEDLQHDNDRLRGNARQRESDLLRADDLLRAEVEVGASRQPVH